MIPRYMQPLRTLIQWSFLVFLLWTGIRFFRFLLYLNGEGPAVSRPAAVEGFLPISALMSLRHWLLEGSINQVHPAALVIFLTVVAAALLLKRSFCSWVCPVGTVSEACWKLGFRLFRRNLRPPRWLDRLLRGFKYLLLLFFLWSIFGMMDRESLSAFIFSDYHKIVDIRLLEFFLHPAVTPLAVIGILLLLSLLVRNPFCRFLCPYGALLGLVSLLSPVKVQRTREACVSCGVCSQVCPSYIDVMAKKRVMSEECLGCWRCLSHCRAAGALEMRLSGGRIAVHGLLFALLVVLLFEVCPMIGKMTGNWETSVGVQEYRRIMGVEK